MLYKVGNLKPLNVCQNRKISKHRGDYRQLHTY